MKNPFANKTRLAPPTLTIELLRRKRPDLFTHSATYAIECLIHEACGLPHPRTPNERVKLGAKNRGKQISKAAKKKK
ncbi:MAG TPA: hypothetical protein VEF04_13025 [Blastocatellia bacterium]|nr:hypothetical protein [Blastocatellia bacterium]